MGDLLTLPFGGGGNVLRVHRNTNASGRRVEALTLAHRHGETVIWQTDDEDTLEHVLDMWRACGACVAEPGQWTPIDSDIDWKSLLPELLATTCDAAGEIFALVGCLPKPAALLIVARFADHLRPKIRERLLESFPHLAEEIADRSAALVVARVADLIDGEKGGHA